MICPYGCTARSMSVFQQSVEKAIFMWNATAFLKRARSSVTKPIFLQAKSMGLLIGTVCVLHGLCSLQISVMQIAQSVIAALLP